MKGNAKKADRHMYNFFWQFESSKITAEEDLFDSISTFTIELINTCSLLGIE